MKSNMLQMSVQTGKRKRIGAVRNLGAMVGARKRVTERERKREIGGMAKNGEQRTFFQSLLHYFSKGSQKPETDVGANNLKMSAKKKKTKINKISEKCDKCCWQHKLSKK